MRLPLLLLLFLRLLNSFFSTLLVSLSLGNSNGGILII